MAENDIEACHRLRGDKAIVKFCKRKICQNVLRKNRSLKKVRPSDVGLNGKHLCLLIRIYAPTTRVCGIERVCAKNCGTKNLYILTSLSVTMSSIL